MAGPLFSAATSVLQDSRTSNSLRLCVVVVVCICSLIFFSRLFARTNFPSVTQHYYNCRRWQMHDLYDRNLWRQKPTHVDNNNGHAIFILATRLFA